MAQSRWNTDPYKRVQGMGTGAAYTPGFGYSVGGPFGGWHNYQPGGGGIGRLPDGSLFGGSKNSLAAIIAAGLQGGNILNHTQFMEYTPGFTEAEAYEGASEYAGSQEEQEQVAQGAQNQTGQPNPPRPMAPAQDFSDEEIDFGFEFFGPTIKQDRGVPGKGGYTVTGGDPTLPDLLGVRGVPGEAWLEQPRPTMTAAAPGSVAEGYRGDAAKEYGYPGQQKAGGYGSLKGMRQTPNPQVFDADARRQSMMNLRQRVY